MELLEALRKHYGHLAFRSGQEEAIRASLAGQDVLLVMPTGSGKSLCYQLAALMLPGTAIVVSPLIALMKDQVDALERKGIPATFINSFLSAGEVAERLDRMRAGMYKLVYVSPERFRNHRFTEALSDVQVSLFTVDEAHCISQWGHDFRPDYLQLGAIVRRLGANVRVMAVTATATPDVQKDIAKQLGLGVAPRNAPFVSVLGFLRQNLYLQVSHCRTHDEKLGKLLAAIAAYKRGIVYCATRKMAERVSLKLQAAKLNPIIYHGAMDERGRTTMQDRFIREENPIVVATNAFGMGVDRADLRFVVHWDVPGSLEAYYQEVGRAGRDGGFAWCELLFNYADIRTQEFFIDAANPTAEQVLAMLQTVKTKCKDGPVSLSAEEWAEAASLDSDMLARTILAMLERAACIARNIPPGQRKYTTELLPETSEAKVKLAQVCHNMAAKRESDENKLNLVKRFVYANTCRHHFLLSYFGEKEFSSSCAICDCCKPRLPSPPEKPDDALWLDIQKALSGVARMKGKFPLDAVARMLRGEEDEVSRANGFESLSTFGLFREKSSLAVVNLLEALVNESCIRIAPQKPHAASLTARGIKAMKRELPELELNFAKAVYEEVPAKNTTDGKSRGRRVSARPRKVSRW